MAGAAFLLPHNWNGIVSWSFTPEVTHKFRAFRAFRGLIILTAKDAKTICFQSSAGLKFDRGGILPPVLSDTTQIFSEALQVSFKMLQTSPVCFQQQQGHQVQHHRQINTKQSIGENASQS